MCVCMYVYVITQHWPLFLKLLLVFCDSWLAWGSLSNLNWWPLGIYLSQFSHPDIINMCCNAQNWFYFLMWVLEIEKANTFLAELFFHPLCCHFLFSITSSQRKVLGLGVIQFCVIEGMFWWGIEGLSILCFNVNTLQFFEQFSWAGIVREGRHWSSLRTWLWVY